MNISRVRTLIKNEVLHGPKDSMLAIAVVVPILMSLFVNLAFGNIFNERAKLGVYDMGQSQVATTLQSSGSISYRSFDSEAALRTAAASGAIDIGIELPADFDTAVKTGMVSLKAFVWGESQAKDRAIIPVVLADAVRTVTGSELPVSIEAVPLGDTANVPWSHRLLPLLVLYGVFMAGLILPASMILTEKQHRTLEALYVSPATLGDIFMAKAVIVVVLATLMGVLTLILSGFFGSSVPLVIFVLLLGAVMATEIGLMAGAWIQDMNSLFAVLKIGGLFLFGPAFIFMFPQIPTWVGYFFPTYYVVRPVVDLSISGASLGDVAVYIGILLALVLLGGAMVMVIVRRLSARALRL